MNLNLNSNLKGSLPGLPVSGIIHGSLNESEYRKSGSNGNIELQKAGKMLKLFKNLVHKLELAKDLPPFFSRIVLAYGFYGPATMKLKNIDGIINWFTGMGMPFPALNAYLAATTETLGFILLFLGLGTRLISFPLIIVLIVAIFTVHIGNGFEAGNNGFEIPLYYLLMLVSLIISGPGRISLDALVNWRLKHSDA